MEILLDFYNMCTVLCGITHDKVPNQYLEIKSYIWSKGNVQKIEKKKQESYSEFTKVSESFLST